ncbi:MAG: 2-aminoethylphosphonate--pyruvate transaminase [Deltaproteobacteria bacterium]|nr:2-aminoethylphosphonate--pyruvate transaminase [Deltaproteobacteria bacterium]
MLLNPGPTNTSARVKQAQVADDICPRQPEFGEVLATISENLLRVVDAPAADYAATLICGSGTAAVEAAIASLVRPNGRLLVLKNGNYGERLVQIARANAIECDALDPGWAQRYDLDALERRLTAQRYTQLAVVHVETSTGVLNDVASICALCRRHNVESIVDSMSALGGIPIDLPALGADWVAASANKCLQGLPGMSFVIGRRARLDDLAPIPGRSLYLNLGAQYRYFRDHRQMRFTPAVSVTLALDAALKELLEEGLPARRARYVACFETLHRGMRDLGFRCPIEDTQLSRLVTPYLEPSHPRYSFELLYSELYRRGYTLFPSTVVPPSSSPIASYFRVANIGAIVPEQIRGFLDALAEVSRAWMPLYA